MVWSRCLVVSMALIAPTLLSRDAAAENGIKPRTPVTWEPAPACLEFVDRSVNPVYSFEYSIPDEDPSPGEALLPDEVDDSRRHQFFAFSRQGNPQSDPPYLWISPADVQAAVEKNLITDTTVEADETLDTSPRWVDRFVRITPDDQRRLIAFESVEAPVEWDTSAAPAGVYQLWGYTWEPAFNIWAQRAGNVVFVHDGDPSEVGPGAAITSGEQIVYTDEAAIIEGCVFAPAGTTINGYFSETPPSGSSSDWQPSWVSFAEGLEVDGESFAVEFVPGGGHETPTLLVYLEFIDPQGRSYEAHMPFLVNVLPGTAGGCDTDGGGFVGTPGCGGGDSSDGGDSNGEESTGSNTSVDPDSGSTTAGLTGSTSGSSSGPAADGDGGTGSGGSCAVGNGGERAGALLLLCLLGLRRRR